MSNILNRLDEAADSWDDIYLPQGVRELVSEAAAEIRLLEKNLDKVTKALSEGNKAQARYLKELAFFRSRELST